MITRDVRHALGRVVAAAGYGEADPGLRPTGAPGQYAASVALTLGANPRETAEILARALARESGFTAPWIAAVDVTGAGFIAITVTPEALAAVADTVTNAGPACLTSDALAGVAVPAPPPGDPLAPDSRGERTWEEARAALAAQVTARLAAAAGATVAEAASPERSRATPPPTGRRHDTDVARAVAFAGRDAVMFTLARAIPGKPLRLDPEIMARHVLGNPAYAVRYAHARAAAGVRWAVDSPPAQVVTAPGELALLDALSWLPERVATAARRGRPDEFARYLEDLARVTVDVLSSASNPGSAAAPGSDRLAMARAARTGLAAGLGLLGISAPERL